jgi:hypothetical protein
MMRGGRWLPRKSHTLSYDRSIRSPATMPLKHRQRCTGFVNLKDRRKSGAGLQNIPG